MTDRGSKSPSEGADGPEVVAQPGHPAGRRSSGGEHADALVLFGASGDLARRELFPALHALAARRALSVGRIVATARQGWDDEDLVAHARDGIAAFGGGVDEQAMERLSGLLTYVQGDLTDPGLYEALAGRLEGAAHPLHYLAVPPGLFADAVDGLARARLTNGARVVVEKPFGWDVASALALTRTLSGAFHEDDIFRVDHFLGLETVQNLLVLRFANEILEPVWNCHHVANVQLTMAEDFGVEGRGGFYDQVGALRDVLQNHLLQVLSLLAMEPPSVDEPASLRDAKVELLRAVRPLDPEEVVRGQYDGYRDEPGVAGDSGTETFVAARLHVDSRRWRGVPFHIRAGKHLPTTRTEVVVEFTRPPGRLFAGGDVGHPNHLRLEIFPGDAVVLRLLAKQPGGGRRAGVQPVDLVFDPPSDERPLAYQPLLADALAGDPTLFGRRDGVMRAWHIVQPVLDHAGPVRSYAPGSWGPPQATALAPPAGWHDPSGR